MVETGGVGVGKGGWVDLEVGNWFPLDFDAGMRFVYVCVCMLGVCVCVFVYDVRLCAYVVL